MNDQNWTQRSINSVWHPCTQMKSHEKVPLLAIERGQGAYLFDFAGNAYLDAISSWWTNLFGHAHPAINQALKHQLDQLEHVMLAGLTHRPVIELSERLSALTGHRLGHAFYASDGASAVEIALKMSFHYWSNLGISQKKRFVCLQNSYHGETLGALGVTDIPIFSDTYGPLLQQALLVKSPTPSKSTSSNHLSETALEEAAMLAIADLKNILEQHHHEIASLIIEPMVQCAAGMQMYSASYLKAVRELCTQYQVLLIADEIAVGFGRTGTFFACEQAGIWPDLMTLSKGLTGGYLPLSVVLATDTIYQAFYQDQTQAGFLHSHSYTGNPLACTAALATLDLFAHTNALSQIAQLSKELACAFYWTKSDPRIMHVRQAGSIFAFDVRENFATPQFSKEFFTVGLEKGLLIRPIGTTVYVMPPYILTPNDVKFLSNAIQDCLNTVLGPAN